jgi:cytochrome b561
MENAMASNSPAGYSGTQILLHWIIAALVLFQVFFFGEGMHDAYDALLRGKEVGPGHMLDANIHVYVGFAVLALAVLRVIIRWTRGVPGAPAGQSGIKLWIAAATQFILYAIIFVMPVTGAMAWFLGYATVWELHSYGEWLIIAAVLVHLAGALMQHYVAKTNVLVRMMKPEARHVS